MFEAKRQHPVAAITTVLEIIKRNFISLLILLFVTSGSESFISIFGILSVVLVLLIGGVLSWLRFTYRVVDGELQIKQGVFVRKNIYLSRERIQVIDIKAGVLQRLFGLVEVEVKTAGSSSKEAKISAITREKAEELKKELRRKDDEETEVVAGQQAEADRVFQITFKDLVIAACTSGSFGIALSIVGTVFSQVDQVLTEDQLIRYLEMFIPASVSTNMVLYIVIVVILISWLLSFLGTIIKYYGFTLTVSGSELITRQGLFEQRQITVPFNRIQAIQIKEGLMRQPFGYAKLILESAGYGEDQGNSTTLYPLIARDQVDKFLQEVVPDYAQSSIETLPPQRAMRRYLFRMVLWSSVLIIPAWKLLPNGWYAVFILPPALVLGYAQYRAAGVGSTQRLLTVRSRALSKTTAIVHKNRIQKVSLSQNPFQKRLGLLSYSITVASGSQGRNFEVRELDRPAALSYFDWVSPLAESPSPQPTGEIEQDSSSPPSDSDSNQE